MEAPILLRPGIGNDRGRPAHTQWAELRAYAPILVVRSPSDAHWAQHDVLVAEGRLAVARLFAPYAK
jgi:hypothetical protein